MTSQHAVVVGGTKGLGRIIVQNFLARGFAVSVVSRHKPADITESPQLRHFAGDHRLPLGPQVRPPRVVVLV